jgi:hypothetical protein
MQSHESSTGSSNVRGVTLLNFSIYFTYIKIEIEIPLSW